MKPLILLASVILAANARATTTLTTSLGFAVNIQTCNVLNASTKPVEVDSVTFVDENGMVLKGNRSSTCTYPGLISPGLACVDRVGSDGFAGLVRCIIVTKGNAKSIHASMIFFDAHGSELILEAR